MPPQPKKKHLVSKAKVSGSKNRRPVAVVVSGGFDPVHVGHLRLFQEAKKLGDRLVVILNNDNWLRKKKGYVFMPHNERKELIEGFDCVDEVLLTSHEPGSSGPRDMSVSLELQKIRPDVFANGGDRNEKNAQDPASSLYWDIATCEKYGIKIVFNVGAGGKVQSSSWLLANFAKIAELIKLQKPPQVS
jgi:D-beta-D-heptose 7-phosphate kinase/D-beta-D-heptose 1-phosphate adenosyltransferase